MINYFPELFANKNLINTIIVFKVYNLSLLSNKNILKF